MDNNKGGLKQEGGGESWGGGEDRKLYLNNNNKKNCFENCSNSPNIYKFLNFLVLEPKEILFIWVLSIHIYYISN